MEREREGAGRGEVRKSESLGSGSESLEQKVDRLLDEVGHLNGRVGELTLTLEMHLGVCRVLARRHEDFEDTMGAAGSLLLVAAEAESLGPEEARALLRDVGGQFLALWEQKVGWRELQAQAEQVLRNRAEGA